MGDYNDRNKKKLVRKYKVVCEWEMGCSVNVDECEYRWKNAGRRLVQMNLIATNEVNYG